MLSIFLRRGLLCCLYLWPIGKELSGENRYPPPEFRRAYCSKWPTGKELSGENRYPPPEFRRAYCSSGQLRMNCPGRINIPHQNSDGPIVHICLVCCCYLSTSVVVREVDSLRKIIDKHAKVQ